MRLIKKLNIEELKVAVFKKNQADKRNKDRLFKLAKANDDIQTIEKLRNEFGFKGARIYLDKLANSSLDDAIKNRDIRLLETLIDRGIDLSKVNILELIIKKYEVDFIKLLIQKEDINKKDKDERTILFHASEYGHLSLVLWALSNGANPDISDFRDATPLLVASQNGFTEIVKSLLKANANINLKTNNDDTPLSQASLIGHYEIVELLLNKGAIITVESLFFSVQNNDVEILKLILSKKVNIDLVREEDGVSPLMIASQQGFTNIVRVLIKNNVNINHQDKNGDTALLLAVYGNHENIVRLLVENNANVNVIAKDKATALSFSFQNNNKNLTKYLISNGANTIPLMTEEKLNPILLNASANGDEELIQLFLDNGADINYKNEYGNTSLMLASGSADNFNIVEILIKNNADVNLTNNLNWSALLNASTHGHIDIVKLLLDNNANPNTKDCDGVTALYRVISNRIDMNDLHITTMKKLDKNNITFRIARLWLKYNANPNIQNEEKTTVLNMCTRIGDSEMVELLLDYGAKMDIQDAFGLTPLMSSIGANHLNIAKILLDYGANVNQTSSTNNATALSYAVENNNLEMVKLLVKSGADLTIKSSSAITKHLLGLVHPCDIKFGTPESLAHQYGFIEINNLLRTQNEINTKNKTIEILPIGKIQLKNNLSIEIYKNYLLFKSQVGNEVFENRYNKKRENLFFNEQKGEILITQNYIEKTSLLNEVIEYTFDRYDGKILDIDKNHYPKILINILNLFTKDNPLKYTTHSFEWSKYGSYQNFIDEVKKEFEKIEDELKLLSPNLYNKINKFLFDSKLNQNNSWGINKIAFGWSSPELKEWCSSKDIINKGTKAIYFSLPHQYQKEVEDKTLSSFDDICNVFKDEIEIRDNDRLLSIFEEIEENVLGFDFEVEYINMDNISFYTDVEYFKNGIVKIFEQFKEREEYENIKIEAVKNEEKNYIDILITQIDSIVSKSSFEMTKEIEDGDFYDIKDYFFSLCDWSIEAKFEDGNYKIKYLSESEKVISKKIDNTPIGFTHKLRFYK